MSTRRIEPELRAFIAEKMPELNKALGPLSLNSCRKVFNAMTGLQIQGAEPILESCGHILAELREMEAAGTLLTEALPNGLAEVVRIVDLMAFVEGAH